MDGPSNGGTPRFELAPETYEAEQREKLAENQLRCNECATPGQPPHEDNLTEKVRGQTTSDVTALAEDLANLETELLVLDRAGYGSSAFADASGVLEAARDADALGAGLGVPAQTRELVQAAVALQSAVLGKRTDDAKSAAQRVADADRVVRRAVGLSR
jgi:hypothetical protein